MASSNFSSLRKNRKSLIDKLADEVKKSANPAKNSGADDRFWKLSVDAKTGIGYAKIRFLAAPKNEELPWARVFSHGFQGPSGSWFIENCPTSLENRPCPVCKENNKLWNSGIESDKDVVRQRKRKLSFISNILVIEDKAHPENEGKVFLFKYGKKIHDKITELVEPQFPDQAPANPFDFWEGCDFKLKAQKVAGYQNYDRSEFTEPSELFEGDDDAKETLWGQEYSLIAFTQEDQFKSYEELSSRLTRALTGDSDDRPASASEQIEREAALPIPTPAPPMKRVAAKPIPQSTSVKSAPKPVDEDEEQINQFFASVLDD